MEASYHTIFNISYSCKTERKEGMYENNKSLMAKVSPSQKLRRQDTETVQTAIASRAVCLLNFCEIHLLLMILHYKFTLLFLHKLMEIHKPSAYVVEYKYCLLSMKFMHKQQQQPSPPKRKTKQKTPKANKQDCQLRERVVYHCATTNMTTTPVMTSH